MVIIGGLAVSFLGSSSLLSTAIEVASDPDSGADAALNPNNWHTTDAISCSITSLTENI